MSTAVENIRRWRQDGVAFVRENFHVEPDEWQAEFLLAFTSQDQPKMRIALQACVGPGKSAVLAWAGWLALSCFAEVGEHPKGAAVSITQDNLKDNLWAELAKWRDRCLWLQEAFEFTKERIFARHHQETWFLSARSWSKSASPDDQGKTLSGLHAKYVIILIDESGEIPPQIGKAAEQAFSSTRTQWIRICQAGNPTSHDGMLYQAATSLAHLWKVIRISGDPDDPKRSPKIDIEWAKQQIATYGRDNPWVMAAVLGQFPPSSINTLLGPDEVAAAMKRHYHANDYEWAQKRMGVDVARFGDDRTVIFPRQGLVAFRPVIMRNARTNDIAARVIVGKNKWDCEMEFVDDTGGWGAGVIDSMIQGGYTPLPVNSSSKSGSKRYFNKRSEMWWELAEWVKRGGALPNIGELARELVTPTYTFQDGKIRLEEKDQIKPRLGFSPDLADALALTFSLPEMPKTIRLPEGIAKPRNQTVHEYDPFDSARMDK